MPKNMTVNYIITECPLGYLLVAATERGICSMKLGDSPGELENDLARDFPAFPCERGNEELELDRWVGAVLAYLRGEQLSLDLPMDVQATLFQRRVWEALRAIPYGATRTYTQVAASIGSPTAVRAVGHACATNPVSLLVPCHRVLRRDGSLGGYRWGLHRKAALLAREQAVSHGKMPLEDTSAKRD